MADMTMKQAMGSAPADAGAAAGAGADQGAGNSITIAQVADGSFTVDGAPTATLGDVIKAVVDKFENAEAGAETPAPSGEGAAEGPAAGQGGGNPMAAFFNSKR